MKYTYQQLIKLIDYQMEELERLKLSLVAKQLSEKNGLNEAQQEEIEKIIDLFKELDNLYGIAEVKKRY